MAETSNSSLDALFANLEANMPVPRVCKTQDGSLKTYSGVKTVQPTAMEATETTPMPFFGQADGAPAAIMREQPHHRLMLWLRAQGNSVKDIAKVTGFNPCTVSNILRQPWALARIEQITTELGRDAVSAVLKGEVLPSVQVLIDVRDCTDARKSDRLAAANSLLDRFLGKPTVHVESKNTNTNVAISAERSKLEEEARQLDEKLKARGIGYPASPS